VLQFELAQDPRICPHFGSRILVLREALETHRQARRLNEEDANALFNTAQVLTSLAEILVESRDTEEQSSAAPLLEEAVELLSACLTRQEAEYSDIKAAAAEMAAEGGVPLSEEVPIPVAATPTTTEEPEEYATILEPITPEALLDTAFAQLSALTALISAYIYTQPHSNPLNSVSFIAAPLIERRIPYFISELPETVPEEPKSHSGPTLTLSLTGIVEKPREVPTVATQASKTAEAKLLQANFIAAMADAEYRYELIDLPTYSDRLATAFNALIVIEPKSLPEKAQYRDVHEAYAEALIAFASTVGEVSPKAGGFTIQQLRLEALTQALKLVDPNDSLSASNLTARRAAEMNSLCGDIEMQRRAIALLPHAPEEMRQHVEEMTNSAGKFYVTATRWNSPPQTEEEKDLLRTAMFKAVFAASLSANEGNRPTKQDLTSMPPNAREEIMRDMLEEELVTTAEAQYFQSTFLGS